MTSNYRLDENGAYWIDQRRFIQREHAEAWLDQFHPSELESAKLAWNQAATARNALDGTGE